MFSIRVVIKFIDNVVIINMYVRNERGNSFQAFHNQKEHILDQIHFFFFVVVHTFCIVCLLY